MSKVSGSIENNTTNKPSGTDQTDNQLDQARQNRTYNPADQAERGQVSEKLNSDAARYKQGPGPL